MRVCASTLHVVLKATDPPKTHDRPPFQMSSCATRNPFLMLRTSVWPQVKFQSKTILIWSACKMCTGRKKQGGWIDSESRSTDQNFRKQREKKKQNLVVGFLCPDHIKGIPIRAQVSNIYRSTTQLTIQINWARYRHLRVKQHQTAKSLNCLDIASTLIWMKHSWCFTAWWGGIREAGQILGSLHLRSDIGSKGRCSKSGDYMSILRCTTPHHPRRVDPAIRSAAHV